MARRKRIQTPGLIRHVMSRGNGRMKIFLDDQDFRKFKYILGDVVDEFELECWDFCLMHNHYHLCVCPRRWNFSEAIQRLNGDYGLWWNARHGRVGHVFQGRFKDQIVQADGYLENLTTYIACNPRRARLVKDPIAWSWSSCAALAGLVPVPGFLSTEPLLSRFGDSLAEQQAAYLRHVRSTSPSAIAAEERFRSKEWILGDAAFKRTVRKSGERAKTDAQPPREALQPQPLIVLA
jgi:REP element-mobilizing transposase RayT